MNGINSTPSKSIIFDFDCGLCLMEWAVPPRAPSPTAPFIEFMNEFKLRDVWLWAQSADSKPFHPFFFSSLLNWLVCLLSFGSLIKGRDGMGERLIGFVLNWLRVEWRERLNWVGMKTNPITSNPLIWFQRNQLKGQANTSNQSPLHSTKQKIKLFFYWMSEAKLDLLRDWK